MGSSQRIYAKLLILRVTRLRRKTLNLNTIKRSPFLLSYRLVATRIVRHDHLFWSKNGSYAASAAIGRESTRALILPSPATPFIFLYLQSVVLTTASALQQEVAVFGGGKRHPDVQARQRLR